MNMVPIAKGQQYTYLSPVSLIYPQCNESLSIPDVKSKMVNVNRMIKRMRAYDELAREIQKDIIRSQGTFDLAYSKGSGRGCRRLIRTLGELVSNADKFNDCKYAAITAVVCEKTIKVRYQNG